LTADTWLESQNKTYRAQLQPDGQLAISNLSTGAITWKTGASGTSFRLAMLSNGNLGCYGGTDAQTRYWSTGVDLLPPKFGQYTVLQNSGILQTIDMAGKVIWSS